MDRSTQSYRFINPIDVPEAGGLDVALFTKRGHFWHPLTLLLDDREIITAHRTNEDKAQVLCKRVCSHTRLSNQGPVKYRINGSTLSVELYVDTYSYIQREAKPLPLSKFPPASFDLDWSSEDYWAVSSMVLAYRLQCPPASNMCWMPEQNVHAHIRNTVLSPDEEDLPSPLATVSLGVSTARKLPTQYYLRSEHDRALALFLATNYNSEGIPPKPESPPTGTGPLGGMWLPLLTNDNFYFIEWHFVATLPTPSPSPNP